MKNMKEEERKLKEKIFRESLKVNEEIKEALCKLSRKKERKQLNENKLIEGLRADIDTRYSERIQWTKDTKEKIRLLKERNLINISDKELLKTLEDKVAIETLGINILKKRIQEREKNTSEKSFKDNREER